MLRLGNTPTKALARCCNPGNPGSERTGWFEGRAEPGATGLQTFHAADATARSAAQGEHRRHGSKNDASKNRSEAADANALTKGRMTMLGLSDIQSPPEELEDYYAQLRAQHVTPAWIGGGISIEPQSQATPYLWRWRDLRPQAMRAAELVGTQQAERRVLRLTNPELSGASASNTLVANIQIVMPGEIALAHRHSAAALRLIIEGRGGYTVVNGERVPMYPGDLVPPPNWSWPDHANDTNTPMIWLDGLDTPLVRMLEAGFYEEYHDERQQIGAAP